MFLTVLLVGCTSPNYIPLDREYIQHIKSSSFVILKTQDHLYAKCPDAKMDPMAYGAIGGFMSGIADGYFRDKAENQVIPIRNQISNRSVEAELKDNISKGISRIKWLNIKNVTIRPFKGEIGNFIKQNPNINSDVIAVLKPNYYITADFKEFVMELEFEIHPLSSQSKALRKNEGWPIYRTKLMHSWPLNHPSASSWRQNRNVELWVENNGERIKSALNESTQILLKDLERQLMSPELAGNKVRSVM